MERNSQLLAQCAHEDFVREGGFSPQPMLHMYGAQIKPCLDLETAQRVDERHAVGSSAESAKQTRSGMKKFRRLKG